MPRAQQQPEPDEAETPPETPPEPETPDDEAETPPEDDPSAFIDPTDQFAVAAYIERYGLEAFQKERLRQVGTIYG